MMLEIFGGTACEFTDFLVTYSNVIVFRILRSIYFIGVLEFDIAVFFYVLHKKNKTWEFEVK